ncbi:hypothetical protein CKO15_00915 [Halorhodospira abdelmalekii]|uniref:c-type cytochrome n=1 Tax=Halorhodospira abdelmalekii TaxID=421629 RepID=UPI001906C79D|nr:hypothetical protein [Halorhodospira abdelmalekii]MBK1733861.1 hypothetical protein [Halorhodospira abdelmalekii]
MLLAGVVSLSIGNALADGVGDGPTGHADGTHSATDRAAGDDPQPISRAKMIAYSCFSCHDRTGQGIKSMPPISGFSPEQMVRMLEDFRDGHGEPTVMDRHAAGYSQEDFEAIAEFLSTMDWEGEVSDED